MPTDTDTNVNSVDPDETARHEPSHQDLRCLPLWFWLKTETPICNNEHALIQRLKTPLQKLRGEWVNRQVEVI